ncbi:DUF2306 domain-containing protein [Blastococcus sp. SYSU DS1021]
MTAALRTTPRPRRRWLVPAALIALALVPLLAGAARLIELSGGAAALPEPPRSAAAPVPLVVHIMSALVFTVVGAFQFVPGTRGRRPRWHRVTGRIVAPVGLVAALSGLWLTAVITGADSGLLTVFRAAAGAGMAVAIVLGVTAVLRRDIRRHRAWMLRGYALGLGAGTQVFTAGFWLVVAGAPGPTAEALTMGAGWLINLAVAEWLIRRRPAGRRLPTATGLQTAPVEQFG